MKPGETTDDEHERRCKSTLGMADARGLISTLTVDADVVRRPLGGDALSEVGHGTLGRATNQSTAVSDKRTAEQVTEEMETDL